MRVLNWLNSTRCNLNLKDFQNLEQSYIFTTTWMGTMGQPAYTFSTDGACAKSGFCFHLVSVSGIKELTNSYNKGARVCIMNPKHSCLARNVRLHAKKLIPTHVSSSSINYIKKACCTYEFTCVLQMMLLCVEKKIPNMLERSPKLTRILNHHFNCLVGLMNLPFRAK